MTPEVVTVLPDKLGGVFTFTQDMLRARRPDGLRYRAVRVVRLGDVAPRASDPLPADQEMIFEHALPAENLYAVLRRLEKLVGVGPGVLVANDWIELALVHWRDTGLAVVNIVHGDFDYYYNLARLHSAVIDRFVTYTTKVHDTLRRELPDRQADIHLLRYGVPIPTEPRQPTGGPLRLLFLGRLHRDKGIFELPIMDATLREKGVEVTWTIHGDGPDRDELKERWAVATNVTWSGPVAIDKVRELYQRHDVFVLPSRFEALPVALLEAGAAGVVPIVSDLDSGIPEVVTQGETGFRVPVGDVAGFVNAIATLAADRTRLEHLSRAVRAHVSDRYDVVTNTSAYQDLFSRWREIRRPRIDVPVFPYGSRLDHPWLPNMPVRAVRTAQRWLRGRPA
jgi:glycosyltransferase involved in cell wall biosynthesis